MQLPIWEFWDVCYTAASASKRMTRTGQRQNKEMTIQSEAASHASDEPDRSATRGLRVGTGFSATLEGAVRAMNTVT
jgi:hypothetical protein